MKKILSCSILFFLLYSCSYSFIPDKTDFVSIIPVNLSFNTEKNTTSVLCHIDNTQPVRFTISFDLVIFDDSLNVIAQKHFIDSVFKKMSYDYYFNVPTNQAGISAKILNKNIK